jgi:hypothetical protein
MRRECRSRLAEVNRQSAYPEGGADKAHPTWRGRASNLTGWIDSSVAQNGDQAAEGSWTRTGLRGNSPTTAVVCAFSDRVAAAAVETRGPAD